MDSFLSSVFLTSMMFPSRPLSNAIITSVSCQCHGTSQDSNPDEPWRIYYYPCVSYVLRNGQFFSRGGGGGEEQLSPKEVLQSKPANKNIVRASYKVGELWRKSSKWCLLTRSSLYCVNNAMLCTRLSTRTLQIPGSNSELLIINNWSVVRCICLKSRPIWNI